jgi:hypothetical protein
MLYLGGIAAILCVAVFLEAAISIVAVLLISGVLIVAVAILCPSALRKSQRNSQ